MIKNTGNMLDRNSKLNVKKSRGEIEVIVKNKDASLTSSAVLCIENQKQPPEVFFQNIVFLKTSQNSQEYACVRVSFLKKYQACGLQVYQIKDSNTFVFLWILRNL